MNEISEEKDLALVPKKLDAVAVFTGNELDDVLAKIKQKATDFVPDITTLKGRKEIASQAYLVSRSKTVLEELGVNLVAEWKEKAKKVDAARKKSRDYLDNLRDEVRQPLTDWEAAEELRIDEEKKALAYAVAWDEALVLHGIFLKEKELAAREAEMARKEAEAKAKEEAEREAKEKAAQEAAAEKARLDREEAIRKESEAKAAEAIAQAQRDKVAAEEKAKLEAVQAEKDRIEAAAKAKQAIADAHAKAEREKIAAEERAKLAAEQAERDKKAAEAKAKADQEAAVKAAQEKERALAISVKRAEEAAAVIAKAEADKLAANKAHRAGINRLILADLVENGIAEGVAKDVIVLIATGKITRVTITY